VTKRLPYEQFLKFADEKQEEDRSGINFSQLYPPILSPSCSSPPPPVEIVREDDIVTKSSQLSIEKIEPSSSSVQTVDDEREKLVDFAYSLVLRKIQFEKPVSFFIHNHRLLSLLISTSLNSTGKVEEKDLEVIFKTRDAAFFIAQEVVSIWVTLCQSRVDLWEKNATMLEPFLRLYEGISNR
jgi:hypothetical protein